MSKRKIMMMALALCMAAILAVGGSLAYFMDEASEDNVFTIGDVSIQLNEEQRGDEDEEGGSGFEDFEQNKELYPIVGDAGELDDETGLPDEDAARNYVDKVVSVTNNGENEAYVRVYFAIPSALDDGFDSYNAGLNVLHFNYGTYQSDAGWDKTNDVFWDWKHDADGTSTWNYFETSMNVKDENGSEMGPIKYNVYYADYMTTLASGETTERMINGVYLDKRVNFVDAEDLVADAPVITTTVDGVEKKYQMIFDENNDRVYTKDEVVGLDFDILNCGVVCPVYAISVQTSGFATAGEAFDEAFGVQYNPWGTEVSNFQ